MQAPPEILHRPLFSAGAARFRLEDVLRAGEAWGDLAELERETAAGVAALARVEQEGPPLTELEIEAAADDFRYARSLLAADEMEAWLVRWRLLPGDWLGYVRRRLAREQHAADADEPLARFGPALEAVDGVLWAELVCSGGLAALAHRLAGRAAAAAALGRDPGSDLALLDEASAELTRRALTPEAKQRLLETRQVDLVSIDCRVLELPEEGMAREAALCVRDDGMSLEEVAARAGASVAERTLSAETAGGLWQPLMSAAPGDVVGPVPAAGGFLLAALRGKRAPSLEDPVVQKWIEDEVARRAIEVEVTNRIRWHERP